MEIYKQFRFEAAHRLPRVPPDHKCHRLHGHSFVVEIHVCGKVGDESGWVVDFAEISAAWRPIHDVLDHHYINEVPGLDNPTSENLARWIWQQLRPALPMLSKVVVCETCTSGVIYEGRDE